MVAMGDKKCEKIIRKNAPSPLSGKKIHEIQVHEPPNAQAPTWVGCCNVCSSTYRKSTNNNPGGLPVHNVTLTNDQNSPSDKLENLIGEL